MSREMDVFFFTHEMDIYWTSTNCHQNPFIRHTLDLFFRRNVKRRLLRNG